MNLRLTTAYLLLTLIFYPNVSARRKLARKLMPPPSLRDSKPRVKGGLKEQVSHLILEPQRHSNKVIAHVRTGDYSFSDVPFMNWPWHPNTNTVSENTANHNQKENSNLQKKRSPKPANDIVANLKPPPITSSKQSFRSHQQYNLNSVKALPASQDSAIFSNLNSIPSIITGTIPYPTTESKDTPQNLRLLKAVAPKDYFQNHFSFNDLQATQLRNNKILFPTSNVQDNSWQPLYSVIPADEEEFKVSSNSYANSLVSLSNSSPVFSTEPSVSFSTYFFNFNETDSEPQHTETFLNTVSEPEIKPIAEMEDDGLVFHLNSTEKIEGLINLLKEYLTNPAQQLSREFAALSQSPARESKSAFKFSPTTRSPPASTAPFGRIPSIFGNGLLEILGSRNNIKLSRGNEVNREKVQDELSIFGDKLTSENTAKDDTNSSYGSKKEIPTPVKIELSDTDSSEDLVSSPSLASLLAISNTVRNPVEQTSNFIELLKLSSHNSSTRGPQLRTTTSACPKLFGQLILSCEIPETLHNDVKVSLKIDIYSITF